MARFKRPESSVRDAIEWAEGSLSYGFLTLKSLVTFLVKAQDLLDVTSLQLLAKYQDVVTREPNALLDHDVAAEVLEALRPLMAA